ncbi:hypothetical protein F5878DRAFT_49531 [Lentinula raphanica]|uniref:Selenoprotein O n=1 Tax=Lentinula raphanica TaxID=153919 RepID=A0AA38UL35_9AGAR|nr:hypothetical protein F5880DRAFT_144334 [Lentinula raphanica]KAJ3844741.1 hypothetical protein F5878DRAFT_49531 [Lentinula raphanica]
MSANFTKFKISSLPIPLSSQLLTHNLVPDPITGGPSVSDFLQKVLAKTPSVQRRARLTSPETHFSYVTPFPTSFPYNIEPPSPDESEHIDDKGAYVEKWLSEREARHPILSRLSTDKLQLHSSAVTDPDQPRVLIGLSETGIRDCIPHLDVGDAFATLGEPALVVSDAEGDGSNHESSQEALVDARQELIDVLGGRTVLMSTDYPKSESNPERTGFAPWSLRYSGHQFGSWAGQLGDGRAVTVLVTPHPSNPNETYELQLKGAGRTPYSRSADGLAVLRSSIREYLCSEAISALGIPTSRSLSLISLPSVEVQRERMETACILTRMAPSFIRIGSFEALSPPDGQSMAFFGGGQQKPHWDSLRILGEWVSKRVLRLDLQDGEPWGKTLLMEAAKRNARMVAGWQAYGWMHGVINTDNVSIMGLTIDYGPYAFMDTFDPAHICNHTDDSGRYSYKLQPSMVLFALHALLNSLAPLIGAEMERGKALSANWASSASEQQLDEWRERAISSLKDEMEALFKEICSAENGLLMRKRLGLRRVLPTDESQLIQPLFDMMENHRLDFHRTFRLLCFFHSSTEDSGDQVFIQQLLSNIAPTDLQMVNIDSAKKDWEKWLDKFKERIKDDQEAWSDDTGALELEYLYAMRTKEAKSANPRFVLRQWVLEEIIKKVENDSMKGKRQLAKVMHMACNPFEEWGAEGAEMKENNEELNAEEKEERRYCGVGDGNMLGFQCSCSS